MEDAYAEYDDSARHAVTRRCPVEAQRIDPESLVPAREPIELRLELAGIAAVARVGGSFGRGRLMQPGLNQLLVAGGRRDRHSLLGRREHPWRPARIIVGG